MTFTFKALFKTWKEAKLASEREHVTPFIKANERAFKINKVLSTEELSKLRWTLDEKEDFELLTIIFKELYKKDSLFCMQEVINLFNSNKNLFDINKMHNREEGYRKSLENDYSIDLKY